MYSTHVSKLTLWKKSPFAIVIVCALLQGPPGIAGAQGNPGPPGEGLPGSKVIKHYDISDNCTSLFGCSRVSYFLTFLG